MNQMFCTLHSWSDTLQWLSYQDLSQILPADMQPPYWPWGIRENSVLRLQQEPTCRGEKRYQKHQSIISKICLAACIPPAVVRDKTILYYCTVDALNVLPGRLLGQFFDYNLTHSCLDTNKCIKGNTGNTWFYVIEFKILSIHCC